MRRGVWAVVGALVGGLGVAPVEARSDDGRAVEYRGLRISVPSGWPVYRLDREPSRCVRFDRSALYLGPVGADQICPSRLIGRTEAMHIEPIGDQAGSDRQVHSGRLRKGGRGTLLHPVTRELKVDVADAGVRITATYDTDAALIRRLLGDIQKIPGAARPSAPPSTGGTRFGRPPVVPQAAQRPRRRWVKGRGFDACTAPSLKAMRAWKPKFVAANIYIGGATRACGDGNLSRYWVSQARSMGWRLIPTYVGLQAPCSRYHSKINRKRAAEQGKESADNAIAKAREFGIGRGAPIYFDIEAYDSRKDKCREAVLRFLDAWTKRLHRRHYVSGVYSSVLSGIRDLGNATDIRKPRAIWLADWDKKIGTSSKHVPDHWWSGRRRIKQYRGPHFEKHGGVKLHIDSDYVHGRVY